MATFRIAVREIHVAYFEIEAADFTEAEESFKDGSYSDGELIGTDYLETLEDSCTILNTKTREKRELTIEDPLL